MRLVLEPRFLFDGSVHAVTKHAAAVADHAVAHHDTTHPVEHADLAAKHPIDIPALKPRPHADQIVFIDTGVADWRALAEGAKADVQVVLIYPGRDGLAQVNAALKGRHDLKAIQFVTEGRSGEIDLGNGPITAATLLSHKASVAAWGDHLAKNGSIEFYGCDVGQGATGKAFVNTVHALTGATVGASTDTTGDAAHGGDWTLERTTGPLNVGVPFTAAALAKYHGVLDTPVPNVTLTAGTGSLTGDTTGDVLLGDNFTETVTFTNTAANATGYGPIINLFVPTNTATDTETATLHTATYLGSALDLTHKFTLVVDPNDSSKVGAFNPYVLDHSGNPTFIDAPAGFKAGDTMYALVLPFGSFTVGQPTASVVLNFTADASSEVTSHSGDSLKIAAVGAYEFGADALANPGADPSILGTAVSSSTTVSLVHIEAKTDLHEDETATGPNNPFNYIVTITTAPAVTNADPIKNFDLTFQLPDQVQEIGGTGAITLTGDTGSVTLNGNAGHPGAAQGGSVTIDFNPMKTTTTVTVPVFVPQTDASGATILVPGSHYVTTVNDANPYSYTANWTPVLGLAAGTREDISVNSTTAVTFTAKALAIQVHDNAGGSAGGDGQIVPGQSYTETIDFQVSDYVDLNNLVITDVIGDGFTLKPGSTVTLTVDNANGTNPTVTGSFGTVTSTTATVNGQTVVVSGSGTDGAGHTDLNYTRNDVSGDGTTTMNFMVGTLLADSLVSGVAGNLGPVLQGGSGSGKTQGTITFQVTALDKYTETNSGKSLREEDFVTNQVVSSGTSQTTANVVNISNPSNLTVLGTTSDTSGLQDDVPMNSLGLTIVDVNGVASDGSSGIAAGDTVTYQLTYTMPAGTDYGNLQLSSFLPLPIFSALDPTASGGSEAFASGTGLVAGTYKLVSGPSGSSISGVTPDGVANSLTFNLGTHDDTTNTAGTVVIQFSVKAQNNAFADALFLTNQANSQNFDAHNAVTAITADAIHQIRLNEPELVTKTGVVSLINDGTTAKGTYTVDPNDTGDSFSWPTQITDPTGAFTKAGTSGNPLLTNPLNADDLNVKGADASDTARVVTTIENTGSGTAYNVEVKGGTIPAGATVADIKVYDANGNQISTANITDLNGNALSTGTARTNAYFSNGIKISDPSGLAHNGVYYVVYDMKLSATQASGATLTTSGTLVNWYNTPTSTNGFVSGSSAVGVSSDALTDNATIGITAPVVDKTIVSTSYAGTTGNNVALGEIVTYQVTLTIPEGTTTNGGVDVALNDLLPAGMTFTAVTSVSYNGVTHTGGSSGAGTFSGSTLNIKLGDTLTNSGADTPATITITYTATVTAAVTPDPGATHLNKASLSYDGATVPVSRVTVTEVDPNVSEQIGVKDDATGNAVTNIYSGETLDYTVTLTNNGNSTANDVTYYVQIPTADLHGVTALNGPAGTTITDTGTQTIGGVTYEVLKVTDTTLAPGGTDTFTFKAIVNDNLTAGTQVTVQTPNDNSLTPSNSTPSGAYYSLPGATGHRYSGSASDTVSVAVFSPTLQIIGESNNTNGTGTGLFTGTGSVDGTIGDIVRYSAYVQVPEGSNDTQLVVTLPPGMTFQDIANDTITVALVSPTGALTSSNVGAGAQQSYSGTFDPASAVATFQLNGSNVHVSGNQITFDLGTLTDNESSAKANYAIVQFNAVVANTTTVGTGGGQTSSLAANVTVGGQTSADATVTVEEPKLTLTKTVSSITNNADGTATITFTETIKNTGDADAFNVSLLDPEAAGNVGLISGLSGTGTLSVSGNGTTSVTASGTLAAGATETITYTETVTDRTHAVADATATVTYTSLRNTTETLSGTTTGASGSATGSRDGSTGTTGLNHYEATATIGFGVVTGRVWNDIGPDNSQYGEPGSDDTGLGGVTVTGTFTGTGGNINETTITAGDGTYALLTPDGSVTVKLPTPGNGGLGSNETLVYNDGGAVTSPASHSGTANSTTPLSNVNFSYQTPDTAPVIAGWGNGSVSATTPSVTYTEGGGAVTLSSAASVTDTEIDESSHDYQGSVLTIQRYNSGGTAAPNSADVFVGTGLLDLSGNTVSYNGVTVGHFTEVNGVLKITFDAGTTNAATVNNVLNAIGYQGNDTGTIGTGIKIGATLDDHNSDNSQGTGGKMTSAAVFVTLNEIPSAGSVTFTEPNNSDPSTTPITLDPTLTVTGAGTFTSATVTIAGFQSEDHLVFNPGALDVGDLQVTVNANGTLTLTSAGGASATQVQNALRSIQYYDTSDQPITTSRTVTFAVTSDTHVTTTAAVTMLNVVATNDSPVLTGVGSLNPAAEDSGPPTDGSTGTLVSTLVGSGHITDPDGAGAHDGGTPGTDGIVITDADTSKGNWYYSLDGGHTWVEFAGSGLPAVSDSHALHLAANAMIYFEPTVTNENGDVPNALTFRAWDKFDSVGTPSIVSGSFSDLTGIGTLGSGTNTDGSAYSSATETVGIHINAVNDAPVAGGTASLTPTNEDTGNPPGDTVANLFGGNFDDSADQQAGNLTNGSTANTLAGIAITGNAATAAQGVWQYSTDGTHWTDIPTSGLGANSAIVLSASDHLRFVPAANYNGVPGDLTVHLIDSSTDVVVTGTTTGADLAAGSLAITGVDISGAHNGGKTAISTGTVDLATSVVAVNDAPVASGTTSLSTTEDTTNPPGQTVGSLFGGNFDDSTDQQHSGGNPTGSDANTLAGIAITGNTVTAAQGVYQYSTDGGHTWTDIPTTGLSDSNALVLSASAEIRFVPAANFNGVPGELTTRLIDSSNVVVTGATTGNDLASTDVAISGVDVSGANHGGTTAVSAGTVVLDTSVAAVNDAPTAGGTATLTSPTEDSTNPSGATVTSLLGQGTVNYSDATDTVTTAVSGGSTGTPAAGIAITGNSATPDQGVYQYSTDGGHSWTTIPSSGLSDTNAIVIPATAEIRFVPVANFNGVPGELTAHVSDGTNLPTTGAHDISGDIGGTGGFSTGTVTIGTSVVAVNDAPTAGGTATLTTSEDTTNPPGTSLGSVLGQGTVHYSDGADTVTTAVSGGSVGTPAAGIAITGNSATPDQGVYQYSTDGGTTWTTIPASGLSDTHAIVIPTTAEIRFVPTANFNGTPGELTAHVSDGTNLLTTGAHDISGDIGGTGGFSTGTITIGTTVTPVNDAPVATGTATLGTTEDVTNPPGQTVGHLFGGNFNDGADQQHSATNPDGSNANHLAGIAITGNAATPDQGVYQYSTDGGHTWTDIPTTGLGDGNALVLSSSAEIRFVPAANFNGVPGDLTTRLIDSSNVVVTGSTTGHDLATSDVAITGVDVSGANHGGTTAVSAATVDLTTSVKAVNDAPTASGSATLKPPAEDSTPGGTSVTSLLGQGTVDYSDSTDTVTTAVSGGSHGTPATGIAITGNSATPDQGVYQYSTDGGHTWTTIPSSGLSDNHAIVIPVTAEIRFVPTANFNGTPGELTAHVSDGTNLPATGAHDISKAIGGTGGFSEGTITIGTTVTPVNDAPIASGSASLPPTQSNATNPPGETVADLYGGHFNDGTDQQRTNDNPNGSTADTLAGIAITGNASNPSEGVYQYSTDGGKHWVTIPTSGLGDSNAIILPATAEIRFVPAATFKGTPGALTSRLIDSSGGALTGAETGVNLASVGGITPYSGDTVQLTTEVTQSGGLPILTPPTPVNVGQPVSELPPGKDHQFPDDLLPAGSEGRGVTDDLLSQPIIPQLDLIGSVGNKFVIAEQHATIVVPDNLFVDSYPGAQLEYDARSPAGGALPQWLAFDARNLTFSGTPPASAHGAVDVVIIARDQFGHEAKATFRILVGRDDETIQALAAGIRTIGAHATPTTGAHGGQHGAPQNGAPQHGTSRHHHGPRAEAQDNAGHAAAPSSVEGLFASLAQPANAANPGRSAFSAQLRDAGALGRLSQARNLLEAIEKVTPVKTAA